MDITKFELFREVVDANFAGEKAEEVKWRAEKMAEMFQLKLSHRRKSDDYIPLD